jgi:chemotaxis protein MotB
LEGASIQDYRMNPVIGRAATEPLILEDPYLPSNRRISIVLLREAKVLPPKYHREMNYGNGALQ